MTTLFDKNFAENVRKAWDANKNEVDNIYHHPTTNGVVKKCIDLSCNKPLTKEHSLDNKPKSNSPERWLEAYVIRQAKQSDNYNGMFELARNNYRFLYSQLKFPRTEKSPARPLDCLLYETKTTHLIIIELKAERVLQRAVEELDYYAGRVLEIKSELTRVFNLEEVAAVEGFIVWPGRKRKDKSEFDLGGWGLIEYFNEYGMISNGKLKTPWEQPSQNQAIEFVKLKESKLIK
jgi:hypothetical protein